MSTTQGAAGRGTTGEKTDRTEDRSDAEMADSGDAEDEQANIEQLITDTRDNGEQLSLNELFDLLKNERRRDVIAFLDEQEDGSTTLDVLAEHIAAKENGIDVRQLSSSQRKRVYIGLYQCHLPKMDDLGVVEYDKNRGTVELQDISQLKRYLADDENGDASRIESSIAVGIAGIVLLGVTGVGPLAVVPTVLWAIVSSVSLLALGGVRLRE